MKLKRGVMRASEFADLEWVNCEPMTLESLRGRVVVVHFWDYTCTNCLRAVAYVKVWHGRYADKGLVIVGVHSPEFEFGHDAGNVRRAVEELGLPFPVASDNSFATWHAYSNRFWPATYLVDRDGFLSDYHFGEGGYQDTETAVQALLREVNPRLLLPKVIEPLRPEDSGIIQIRPVSPEIYLGYRRGRLGNPEGFVPGGVVAYARPATLVKDVCYADGEFLNRTDCLEHVGAGTGRVILSYDAVDVSVVVEPARDAGVQRFAVEQDGRPVDKAAMGESLTPGADGPGVDVDAPRLYHIVRNPECDRHTLALVTSSPGLRFYCISFVGSCAA